MSRRGIQWAGFAIMTVTNQRVGGASDRPILAWVLSGLVVLACWGYLFAGAGTGMSTLMTTTPLFPPSLEVVPVMGPWSGGYAVIMVGMWWSMMIAMMAPGFIVATRNDSALRGTGTAGVLRFNIGYALVWLLFSVAATVLQYTLEAQAVVHGLRMWSIDKGLSIGLLIFAGLYQFSNVKRRGMRACEAILSREAEFRAGVRYGANCVLSTFALMLLLFVGGVMNLYWIVLLTAVVTAEKMLKRCKQPIGAGISIACFLAAALILGF